MNLDTARYLESVEARHAVHYTAALRDMLVAMTRKDRAALDEARARLQQVIDETMGIAEVLGASSMLRAAAGVHVADRREALLRRDRADIALFRESAELLANVTFQEALDDMVTRTPTFLRNAAERTARNIARLYSEGRVVAFARSAEQSVTDRVQALIVQAIRDGIPEAEAGTLIRMGVDEVRRQTDAWTESYARMAFRTNVNTAVTAGRFRQAMDQDVREVIPAFRYDTAGDSDVRPNHRAADGRIWSVSNPVWNRLAPPNGYACRCQASLVTTPMLRRMGRLGANGLVEDSVPPGAFPDPGFRHGGRPDLFINGA